MQETVERWPHHRPKRMRGKPAGTLRDQLVDDVRTAGTVTKLGARADQWRKGVRHPETGRPYVTLSTRIPRCPEQHPANNGRGGPRFPLPLAPPREILRNGEAQLLSELPRRPILRVTARPDRRKLLTGHIISREDLPAAPADHSSGCRVTQSV